MSSTSIGAVRRDGGRPRAATAVAVGALTAAALAGGAIALGALSVRWHAEQEVTRG